MTFRPYLAFAGNAREAFTRYQQIFGGELVLLDMASAPPEAGPPPDGTPTDAIMHAALTVPGDALLMGADGPVDGSPFDCLPSAAVPSFLSHSLNKWPSFCIS